MPFAAVYDIQMYYEEAGTGEPLVLLHGALGAIDPAVTSGWAALLPALAARYRTVSLESRGHGRTDSPTGQLSYAQMADDVAAFIAQLDLAPVQLAGFSDGATVGLALGMTRPDLLRSLVCVGANYRQDAALAREIQRVFDPEAMERDAPTWVAVTPTVATGGNAVGSDPAEYSSSGSVGARWNVVLGTDGSRPISARDRTRLGRLTVVSQPPAIDVMAERSATMPYAVTNNIRMNHKEKSP